MKTIYVTLALALSFAGPAQARDIRDKAVIRSAMVQGILQGLKTEQKLTCKLFVEEDGSISINYFTEDNVSKFRAGFRCNDGRTVVLEGIFGDGGPHTETFSLGWAN